MRKLSLVLALVVLAVPAAAQAKKASGEHKNAAKQCKALRAEMGGEAFRAAFGARKGKNAFGRCVSAQRKARRDARKAARKACRAKGLRGQSMKRCVRAELAADPAPKPADYQNAVEECRAEQSEDPEGFTAEFGDGSNAFGKCVAHEVSDDDEVSEPEDEGDEPETDEPEDVEESPGDEPAGEI